MLRVSLSGPKMCRCIVMFLASFAFLLCPWIACPEEPFKDALPAGDALDEELQYLQEETYVITPSRIPQRIEKAPGSIYVVTDKQIRQMGARYLYDVVETVPGWYTRDFMWPAYVPFVRGAAGYGGEQILVMVNSHVINEVYTGNSSRDLSLDLDNVKRIEFVTGAGSALYGSGAMAGIINVITKEGEDVDGVQLTGRGGSYNTWEGNVLFGKKVEGLEVSGYLDYMSTDGLQGYVGRDWLTGVDQKYGTDAFIAPGNMETSAYQWDGQLTIKYKGFKFDGKYLGRKFDLPFGNETSILEDNSYEYQDQYYLTLGYDATLMEGLDLAVKAYRNQYSADATMQSARKGHWVQTPDGPKLLSETIFFDYSDKDRRTGGEAQSTYKISDANTLVGGVVFE